MAKQTAVSFLIQTDDNGNRKIFHRVTVSDADKFDSEEAKEESTVADINHLFDEIGSGRVNRDQFV